MRELRTNFKQLATERFVVDCRIRLAFHAQNRLDVAITSHADQRGAKYSQMSIEHGLAGNREKGRVLRHDTLRFSPAEPESAAVVEISEVAHAMIEAIRRGNLGELRRFRSIEIRRGHPRTLHGDLADLARGNDQFLAPTFDRIIGD